MSHIQTGTTHNNSGSQNNGGDANYGNSTPHSNDNQSARQVLDTEVVVKAERRHYTAEYKQRILQEADACTQLGAIGALLRREGLYSSHLTTWRRERKHGELQGLTPAKRGRKANPEAAENARLHREVERLQRQLQRAELIIDVQKKSHGCLA